MTYFWPGSWGQWKVPEFFEGLWSCWPQKGVLERNSWKLLRGLPGTVPEKGGVPGGVLGAVPLLMRQRSAALLPALLFFPALFPAVFAALFRNSSPAPLSGWRCRNHPHPHKMRKLRPKLRQHGEFEPSEFKSTVNLCREKETQTTWSEFPPQQLTQTMVRVNCQNGDGGGFCWVHA